jgi:hypothetical protein
MFDHLEHVRIEAAGRGWARALRWSTALLIAVAAYAVIARDFGPGLGDQACEQVTKTERLVAEHRERHGGCPDRVEDLVAPRGRFIDVRDPWGTSFGLRCDDDGIVVTSAGPDRTPQTEDDIVGGRRDAWLSACGLR